MYVMSVRVDIQEGRSGDSVKDLHAEVVPTTKTLPGFVKGMWFGDETHGNAAVVFDTRESAEDAAANVSSRLHDPVSLRDVAVYELRAEA
jgi:hypothetical protein